MTSSPQNSERKPSLVPGKLSELIARCVYSQPDSSLHRAIINEFYVMLFEKASYTVVYEVSFGYSGVAVQVKAHLVETVNRTVKLPLGEIPGNYVTQFDSTDCECDGEQCYRWNQSSCEQFNDSFGAQQGA